MFFKSKEEKEIERKIRIRKAKAQLKNYISGLEKLQKKVLELGREASQIGDKKLVKRQAEKYLALENRIRQAKRLLILMEEAEAQRELVKITSTFIAFSKDIVDSIVEGPDVKDVAKMHVELEKAMAKAESLEEVLSVIIDSASESILSGDFDEGVVEEVVKMFESESKSKEIDEKIREIEEMMKRG